MKAKNMAMQPPTRSSIEIQTKTENPCTSVITLATLMLAAVALWLVSGFTLADAAPVSGAGANNGPASVLRAPESQALHQQAAFHEQSLSLRCTVRFR